jgi:DNA-binding phage protein
MKCRLQETLRRWRETADENERARLHDENGRLVAEMLMHIARERGLAEEDLPVKVRVPAIVRGLERETIAWEQIERYLQRCVTNSKRDILRRARREHLADGVELERLPDPRATDVIRVIAARQHLALVRSAMDSGMPRNYRRVIEEIVIKGRKRSDLAQDCQVDRATVDRWLSRARAWLRKRVVELAAEDLP